MSSNVTGRNCGFSIDCRFRLFFKRGNTTREDFFFLRPHKSETLAACLTQCLKGDGWNADKSISMLGRKPQMLRLCPLAAAAVGFPHKASGSGEEPDLMSATRTQYELRWAEGQIQRRKMFLWFGSEPIPQMKCGLFSATKLINNN